MHVFGYLLIYIFKINNTRKELVENMKYRCYEVTHVHVKCKQNHRGCEPQKLGLDLDYFGTLIIVTCSGSGFSSNLFDRLG